MCIIYKDICVQTEMRVSCVKMEKVGELVVEVVEVEIQVVERWNGRSRNSCKSSSGSSGNGSRKHCQACH